MDQNYEMLMNRDRVLNESQSEEALMVDKQKQSSCKAENQEKDVIYYFNYECIQF